MKIDSTRVFALWLAGALLSVSVACSQIIGIEELTSTPDGGQPGSDVVDAGSDANQPGGDGDGPDLSVVATTPPADAVGVDVGAEISVQFSAPVDSTTVTRDSVFVTDSYGNPIDGDVATDGMAVRFIPRRPLALREQYTATVTADVRNMAGTSIENAHTWTFAVRDGQWSPSLRVSEGGLAQRPSVAVNARGEVFAAWRQQAAPGPTPVWQIFANRYVPGVGWGVATALEDLDGSAEPPALAVDPLGNAAVVWGHSDGTRINILASRYRTDIGWESARFLEFNADGDAVAPRVAMDGAGNAMVVWQEPDGIWTNRARIDADWAGAKPLSPDNGTQPVVALHRDGRGLAVWVTKEGVQSASYAPGDDWQAPVLVSPDEYVLRPQIAIDDEGVGVVGWATDFPPYHGRISRHVVPTGWQTPETAVDSTVSALDFALGARGHIALGWHAFSDTGPIFVQRLTPGGQWSAPKEISVPIDNDEKFGQRLAVDRQGSVFAVWMQWSMHPDTPANSWLRRYVPEQDWGEPEQLRAAQGVTNAFSPQVVASRRGNAVTVWVQGSGTFVGDIYARVFE